ncbi:MAG: hypothetical protein H7147_04630, partial [Frankiaceae bacterium]|nr:hypothetical protein [Arenimonas sp.]
MSVLAIIVIIVGIWLALKVVGALFKLGLVLVVVLAVYWLIAPFLGMPR